LGDPWWSEKGPTPATLARLLPSDIRYIVGLDLYILPDTV
jgi:hypothetical protein